MHPPFRPRLSALPNPKKGLFAQGEPALRQLGDAIDADSQLTSRRFKLAKMLMARGEDEDSAFGDVDTALYDAWANAKATPKVPLLAKARLDALRAVLSQMKRELDKTAKQTSLTGASEEGEALDIEVEGVSAEKAESLVGAEASEATKGEVLQSYNLAPGLYNELVEGSGSITQKGKRAKRTNDAQLAQQHSMSTKDIAALRQTVVMLAFHATEGALMSADELESWVDRLT